MNSNPNCLDCAFFHLTRIRDMGQCRRNPPQVIYIPKNVGVVDFEYESTWPIVAHDHWCGEFKREIKK